MLTVGRIAFEKNLNFLIDVLEQTRQAVPDVLMVLAFGARAPEAPGRETAARR